MSGACSAGGSCSPPQTLCGSTCSNLGTDVLNCGACGTACSIANNIPACIGGACKIGSCTPGFADCNANPVDGCETNTNSVSNCGACGNVCSTPNGNPACFGGACQIASCNAGFADCNGNPVDGCEVNLASDSTNCGGCGIVCPGTPNGTAICRSSTCDVRCNGGFHNCGGVCTPNGQLCQ